MDAVTSVRSQMPAALPLALPERVASAPAAQTAPPVVQTVRNDAVQHPSTLAAQVAVELADQDEDQHPASAARAAADAARAAYIKASIAAGVSPLPMPGA
ncbi:MAG: hypothetical protein B7Z10_04965 [Rhodobacterales bacterium 32-66-7]|nr:MAG: hypothetical protein B7Z31_02860 [Rhodobacterales bacterium 12-65-15]OYX25853.1 MAG: hypothetical protein B7Z10_04965 [Rhodobacterales bacterium 32-66-7]